MDRKCRNCGETKDINEYKKYKNSKNEIRHKLDCRLCFLEHERNLRLKRITKNDKEHANRILEYRERIESRGDQPPNTKWCGSCSSYKELMDFSKTSLDKYGQCRKCSSEYSIKRTRDLKLKAIKYLGDSCVRCGSSNLHYSSYDFHHRDPNEKEFDWSRGRKQKFENITEELDKCDLMCSLCHRFVHCKYNNDGSINEEFVELIIK